MAPAPSEYDPGRREAEVDQFWRARGLPRPGGISGPPDGPILHAFEGALVAREGAAAAAFRAVAADVDTRYLALVGRRGVGTLRFDPDHGGATEPVEAPLLRKLVVWTGGGGPEPWESGARARRIEQMVGRLARQGSIVSRDLPLRICPSCGVPRAPERIIYQEEEGTAYVVRFDLEIDGRNVAALVWSDAPWKLLGTCGILLHPFLPYVVVRYGRRDASELVLTSRSSLDRLREWIPGATFEILEERPGQEFAGKPYQYPLRHEFPMGGTLTPPGGTVIAVPDVTDTGTGIVPLVPGHGATDAALAAAHGIPGWPLLTPRGQLDFTLIHKYAGLDLRTANEFIVRDLAESSAIFAQLTVRRGVPHCLVCGTALIWMPGRAWCLEPGRLPPEAVALYARLLPNAPALPQVEVAPWPVSETTTSEEADAVALLECAQCERLDALDGPAQCRCGGKMFPVRRRLTASVAAVLGAWARFDPFPPSDSARLYVGQRRRIPGTIHHLVGISSVVGPVTNVGLTVLPTLPQLDLAALAERYGADAVRSALVRTEATESSAASFEERCRQEARRLGRLAALAEELLAAADPAMLSSFAQPVAGALGELEPEDRALLARWEQVRVRAIADFDRVDAGAAHRRVFHFLETDLAMYRQWVRPRLALAGSPPTKQAALRALIHLLRTAVALLGPILPVLAESIHRRLVQDRVSLFETTLGPAEPALLNEELIAAWDRWRSVVAALAEFRRANGVATETVLASVSLVLATDEDGDRLRADRPVLERLGAVRRIDVGSPREPWAGRRRVLRPVESEIQRAYPAHASQIVHLLRRMPPRRTGEGSNTELSVVIQGLPRRVMPSMVEYVDTLPANMVPVPWALGELYVERGGPGPKGSPVPPPLSPDAFWLVRHLDRRLRNAGIPPAGVGWKAIIVAVDPLAGELRTVAEPLAAYLGLAEIQVPETFEAAPPPNRLVGRTRTGARWWVLVPGLPPPVRRSKHRRGTGSSRRIPTDPAPAEPAPPEVDFADEKVIAQEEAVRALNQELDGLLRVPLLGPAKIRAAWASGFVRVDDYRKASHEQLLAIPGFGGGIADAITAAVSDNPVSASPAKRAASVRPPTHRPRATVARPPSVRRAVLAPRPIPTETIRGAAPPSPVSAPVSEAPAIPTELTPSSPDRPPAVEPPPPETIELPAAPIPEVGPAEESHEPTVPTSPVEVVPNVSNPSTDTPSVAPPTSEGTGETGPAPPADSVAGATASAVADTAETELPDRQEATDATATEPEVATEAAAPEALNVTPEAEAGMPQPLEEPAAPELTAETASGEAAPPVPETSAGGPESPEIVPASETSEPPFSGSEPEESAGADELSTSASSPSAPGAEEEIGIPAESPADEENPPPDTGELPALPSTREREEEMPTPAPPPETEEPASSAPVSEPVVESPAPVEPAPRPEGDSSLASEPAVDATAEPSLPVPTGDRAPEEPLGPPEEPLPEVDTGEPAPTTAAEPESRLEPEIESALAEVSRPPVGTAGVESPELPTPSPEDPPLGPVPPIDDGSAEAGLSDSTLPLPVPSPEPSVALPSAPTPPPESPIAVEAPAEPPPPGGIDLRVGSQVLASLQPFLDATAAGLTGVCVVRESPERIHAQAGGRPITVYWLSNLERERTLRPNDLAGLAAFFTRELTESHVAVFFIEGIEYLARIHGIDPVLDRLREFDDLARSHEARVWLHVDPDLMRPADLARVLAAFGGPRTSVAEDPLSPGSSAGASPGPASR